MAENLTWPQMHKLIGEEIGHFREIKSGVHIALLATTRGGKTTLATGGNQGNGLLSHFEDCLVIDSTGDPGFISEYGKPLSRFGSIHGHRRLTVTNMEPKSKEAVAKAILKASNQGNVAIYADELRQLVDGKYFGLGKLFDHLWLFTAKKGVSVIGGSQAPRWLPGAFYDQSKIAFVFGVRDIRTRKRLSEIAGDFDSKELDTLLPSLKPYQFAHIGIDGTIQTSRFQLRRKSAQKEPAVREGSRKVRIIRS